MGQRVTALMYGCVIPQTVMDRIFLEDGDYVWDCFGEPPSEKQLPKEFDRMEISDDGEVMGFVFAVSAGARRHEGDLPLSCALRQIPTYYSKVIEETAAKWTAFAAWLLRAHGISLPGAELIMAETERA